MLFRRTITAALLVGLTAGLVFSLAQALSVNPINFAAEAFEVEAPHDHGTHSHGGGLFDNDNAEPWAPQDGAERASYTIVANVLAGIGFAAILLSVMSQLKQQGTARINALKGVVWGAAGFAVFFVAPSIGFPPEIPGVEAAPINNRQAWWIFAVVCVGVGLMIFSFARLKYKLVGIALAILPYTVVSTHPKGPIFAHPDPDSVIALTQLHQQFIIASGLSNLAFWLVLGVCSAWILNGWVLKPIALSAALKPVKHGQKVSTDA